MDLQSIVNDFDIPFLKELELSQREFDTEKAKIMKKSLQEQSSGGEGTVRTITNRGNVVNRPK